MKSVLIIIQDDPKLHTHILCSEQHLRSSFQSFSILLYPNNVFPSAFKILTKNDTSFFHKNKLNQVAHFFPPSPLKTENPYRLIQNWVTLPSLHGKIKPIWLAFLKPINQNFEEKNT